MHKQCENTNGTHASERRAHAAADGALAPREHGAHTLADHALWKKGVNFAGVPCGH